MKGNKNMEKQKRITLNADKRKVIADVFQDHFELNSKFNTNEYNNFSRSVDHKIDDLLETKLEASKKNSFFILKKKRFFFY